MMPVNKFAKEMGRRGGKQRARNLTPEERKESARKAAQERWKKEKNPKLCTRPATLQRCRLQAKARSARMVDELLNIFRFDIA